MSAYRACAPKLIPFANVEASLGTARSTAGRRHFGGQGTVDVVISPNEISFAHGTGVLLSRLLEGRKDIVAIRSQTTYGGSQRLDARETFVLPTGYIERQQVFALVSEWLRPYQVRSVLCVPWFETDLVLAIAAASITGAPLGIWIMDDNCLVGGGINEAAMREAVERASALFAISPELRDKYETQYRKKMWIVPPCVPSPLIRRSPVDPAEVRTAERRGVMVGNVWSERWLNKLRAITRETGIGVTWYASNKEVSWLTTSEEALIADGITLDHGQSTEAIIELIARAAFVIVPSDPGGGSPQETAVGAMSLPTRIPFVVATSGTPIIVLGTKTTVASRFVGRFDLGLSVPYEAAPFAEAVADLSQAERQRAIRLAAYDVAPRFSFEGVSDLLFDTIRANGVCRDLRFERLFRRQPQEFGYFTDYPVDPGVWIDFREVVVFCARLKREGWQPDFVLDIGASNGIWSHYVADVFDEARFVLCDPLFSKYGKLWKRQNFTLHEAAISNESGRARFQVSEDLFGSSLLSVSNIVGVSETIDVPKKTIDEIAESEGLSGRGFLKVDVQFAEHLVLAGALRTLADNIDVVILELTLQRSHPEAKTLVEMCRYMEELGFRVFDHVGEWRAPQTGELEQLDMAFVRLSGLPRE